MKRNTIANLSLPPVEPGEIPYSFTNALAPSLWAAGCTLDRKAICGASGFAFRIWVEVKEQCPSAMSIFDFDLLRVAVELCGHECTHITRLWQEEAQEEERRGQAHEAIKAAVDRGIPPVVWDVGIPEWGLIAGYDEEEQAYETIDCFGQRGTMPYGQLGKREIPILAVTIPGAPTGRSPRELARETVRIAVDHARGREWEERPAYENGLAAYPAWAALMGRVDQTGLSGRYYAGTYAHFRDCAAHYLTLLAGEDPGFQPAAQAYARVAAQLRAVRDARNDSAFPAKNLLERMERAILAAQEEERGAVELLETMLSR